MSFFRMASFVAVRPEGGPGAVGGEGCHRNHTSTACVYTHMCIIVCLFYELSNPNCQPLGRAGVALVETVCWLLVLIPAVQGD